MKIFISYRRGRDGGSGMPLVLHDRLERHFGHGCVFLDRTAIEPGEPFPQRIEQALHGCHAMLVLIDARWLDDVPRLHEDGDWVRREIEVALERMQRDGVMVMPVLVDGRRMPAAAQLPPSLARLATLQAQVLDLQDIAKDVAALVSRLTGWTPERLLLWLRARRRAAVAAAAGVTLLAGASAVALLDALTLDTRLEALTMSLADRLDPAPLDARLLTVVVDRQTEARIGRPFDRSWRAEHARLIRRLADAGATAVAFDIALVGSAADDAALVQAAQAARAGGLRVAFGLDRTGVPPTLATPALDWGLLCIGTELDWARVAPLAAQRPSSAAAALPAALALRAAHGGAAWHEIDGEHRLLHGQAAGGAPLRVPFTRTEAVAGQQACAALAPGDTVAQQLVRFSPLERLRDPAHRLRYEALCCDAAPLAALRGRIVVVGSELDPDDAREVARGWSTERRWGYEVHADVVNTLLAGTAVRPLQPLAQFVVMSVMAVLGLGVAFWRRLWRPWRQPAVSAGVVGAYGAAATLAVAGANLLPNSAYHLGAFLFALGISRVMLRRYGLIRQEAA